MFATQLAFLGLNILSGVIAIIWFITIGAWQNVFSMVLGLAASYLIAFAVMMVLIPIGLFGLPWVKKGWIIPAFVVVLLSVLAAASIVHVCFLLVFKNIVLASAGSAFLPWLVGSFAVCFAGWTFMQVTDGFDWNKHGVNMGVAMTSVFGQAAHLAAAFLIYIRSSSLDPTVVYIAIMLIGVLVQTPMILSTLRTEQAPAST
jgi:hypothetical protein